MSDNDIERQQQDRQMVRDLLMEHYQRHGTLTPEGLLEEATDVAHPLHHRFEWDDSEAAHKYRLEQSRGLIRSVKIRFTTEENTPRELRAFVALKGEQTHRAEYKPVEEVVADPFQRELLVRQFLRDWKIMERRYQALGDFTVLVQQQLQEGTKSA